MLKRYVSERDTLIAVVALLLGFLTGILLMANQPVRASDYAILFDYTSNECRRLEAVGNSIKTTPVECPQGR